MTSPRPFYPGLDTLRALAAISVLATHTSFWTGQYSKGLWGAATSRLDIGVAFFFVLSGFLLGRPYFAATVDRRARPRIGSYLRKRALRIIPLYLLAVVLALILLPENRGTGVGTWLSNLTLTHVYTGRLFPAGLTQMWSLSTEVAFYLLLPLLTLALAGLTCRHRWNPRGLLLGLAGLGVMAVAWLAWVAPMRNGLALWLPAYFTWFGVGLALAVVSVDIEARDRAWTPLTAIARQPGTCWVIALGLFAIAATPVAGPTLLEAPTEGAAVAKNLLYAAIAGIIVLPSVLGPSHGSPYSNVLGWRPFRHVGHISYGIFCLHLMLIHAIAGQRDIPLFQGRGIELFVLTLVASIAAAEVTYRLVERPAMRLKDFTIRSSKAKTATADTAASTSH